jgi:lipopolysaccharide heptosyltransferase II
MTMPSKPQRILVVLPTPMGDGILATPSLRRLRRSLPQAHITYLANAVIREVLTGVEWVDHWIDLAADRINRRGLGAQAKRLRAEGFTTAILYPNSFRSALLIWKANIPYRIGFDRDGRGTLLTRRVQPIRLGKRFAPISMLDYYDHLIVKAVESMGVTAAPADRYLELDTSETDKQQIDALWQRWQVNPQKRMVILVPGGAFGPSKWWPTLRFAELADRLVTQNDCQVVLSCAPNPLEQDIAQRIQSAVKQRVFDLSQEQLSLGGLKELIRRCSLVVANDTGPCHIAAAFGIPLVTLFGPTDPRWTATGYAKEIRLRYEVGCGPCQEKICLKEEHCCMEAISVEEVYAAANEQLQSSPPGAASHPESQFIGTKDLCTTTEILRCAQNDNAQPRAAVPHGANLAKTYFQPYSEQYVPQSDSSGLVHDSYKDFLQQAGLLRFGDIFDFRGGQRLDKPGLGQRERFRIELKQEDGDSVVMYLKRFGPSKLHQVWQGWLGHRREDGVNDFAATMMLAEAGIAVARPIAFGRDEIGRSFVMLEELPNSEALERLLPWWDNVKNVYQLLQDKRQLLKAVAALVRRFHGAGYFHRDLYLSHIFLSKDKEGYERLNLIDLQRVFKPVIRRYRWRVKDLAQLYYSAQAYFTNTDSIRFLRWYLDCRKLRDKDKTLARTVWYKAQRIARHDRKRKQRGSK